MGGRTRSIDQALADLKRMLLGMGEKVATAVEQAVDSLLTQNVALAQQVRDSDQTIDTLEATIDDTVIKLIATQQPVAKDLRKLISTLRMAADFERMADLATNIADVTMVLRDQDPTLLPTDPIVKMAELTQQMIRSGIVSYVEGDSERAYVVSEADDEVDRCYRDALLEWGSYFPRGSASAFIALQFCFVARYLERIADHTTNIAEHVVYTETGHSADLN
ncbi:phosphate signaling complex protein PhoU [Pasteuria penetrans]|uniref:phosphate signaling complex protein PhoU n=1 Tax=Pasteuria penetrans TaxID=86005 RepID=UPI000F910F05|nr:phosphate signaling complex protein PhoU [Pasteuria penetrans]